MVVGKGGDILYSRVYHFADGNWSEVAAADAAIDSYQLETSAAYGTLGIAPGNTYTVTFLVQDWFGRADDLTVALPARILSGTKEFGGIIINELFSRAPPIGANDWIELYNTGTSPISIEGWTLYADGVLAVTFGAITIQPGEFYVATNLNFAKATNYQLFDAVGNLIDQVTTPEWQSKSYGRIGTPEEQYQNWSLMNPTPGAINEGQTPIPEFGSLLMPVAIVPIIILAITRRRRRETSEQER